MATAPDFAETPLHEVSFELWAGEVLGIAGVDGNGQKHLAEVLAGQRPLRQGRIELAGSDITRGRVPERRQRGIRYVTDDRLGEGTVGTFSVATNLVLKEIGALPYWRHGISDWELIHRSAREQILRNDIRTPSELTPVGKLSGGNVQKVLLARELDAEANVAILNKPTYGLDLHNQRLALDRIVAAAARGVAVIVISTDLDELLEISDRIGVMFQGRLAGIVENGDDAGEQGPAADDRGRGGMTTEGDIGAGLTATMLRVLIPVALALVVGGLILLVLGKDPLGYYGFVLQRSLLRWGGAQETLTRMAPLLLIAAGLIVAFRAGIWNLGGDGQFLLAAVASAALAPALGGILPRGPTLVVCMIVAQPGGRALVVDSRAAQGALRRQRDHHDADDELSRHEPRERADKTRAARSGYHGAADPQPRRR